MTSALIGRKISRGGFLFVRFTSERRLADSRDDCTTPERGGDVFSGGQEDGGGGRARRREREGGRGVAGRRPHGGDALVPRRGRAPVPGAERGPGDQGRCERRAAVFCQEDLSRTVIGI